MIAEDWFLEHSKKPEEKILQKFTPRPNRKQSDQKGQEQKAEKVPRRVADLIEYLSVKEVAAHLRCHPGYVYEQIETGRLKCQPFGRRRVVPVTALHEFLMEQKKKYDAENRHA